MVTIVLYSYAAIDADFLVRIHITIEGLSKSSIPPGLDLLTY